MGFLSIFKNKKSKADSVLQDYADKVVTEFQKNDFLGKAAEAGHKAKAAVKSKKHDEAWGLYHEQKSFYMQHANQSGFTAEQALALDASVHEEMANILRLENKHEDALVNIVYWVMASPGQPTKRHQQKLQSYFNRCKFKNTTLSEVSRTIDAQTKLPEFTLAKSLVYEWIARG
jgi:CRISPR/Cas system type I-B associated protein Csh2 (Cas7 group RAMP superfamily)